ncbi:hypothetical protein, partial [Kingella kingae]|uniref:hypothetical protein n=1 Tax=Kingella kingae TaxID=504 RepID=UPI0025502678
RWVRAADNLTALFTSHALWTCPVLIFVFSGCLNGLPHVAAFSLRYFWDLLEIGLFAMALKGAFNAFFAFRRHEFIGLLNF